MKKFYTMIAQQPIERSKYGDENGNLYPACNHAVYFPLTVALCNEIKKGEPFVVIAMDSFNNEASKINYELLCKELKEHFDDCFEIVFMNAPVEMNGDGQIALFKKIYQTFEKDDEIFFDITFGYRLIPMTILIACNYAKKFVEGIRVRQFIYGVFNFQQKDNPDYVHHMIDVTSLFYLNDFIDKLAMFETEDPTKLIDQLFTISTKGE